MSAAPETLRSAPRRRVDASNNRALLLDAAEQVFLTEGTSAPLDLIASRAGVGRATLFRNFPDRLTLMRALRDRALDRLQERAQALRDDPNAFLELLRYCAQRIALSAPLVEYFRSMDPQQDDQRAAAARYVRIFSGPMRRCVKAGLCRPDLQPTDILLLSALLKARAIHLAQKRKKLAARSWVLMLAAAGIEDTHGV
ncbi:MAG TPA: TetR/AcrR family transcriptional regulator [Steroidobacter sp.]